ncbi:bifunctional folylpolyglutamate synthase/dihydrofolate synthase [Holdemania massiliensis]|nr:folylpolyglutamate synthase/dihydrofolate synthase family protein [Holdemania massiliensis]
MTTIQEAVEWITARHNFHHGFDHFQRFMASQGDPQDQFRSIHVAGTNGKGSTVSYLASCLSAAGYTVGTFTSPHLTAHQDRIRIQDQWINDETFVRFTDTYRELIEQWDLAMFEIDFFFACLWFIERKVDIAVIEVGLGGLWDSTNTLHHPLCSVIVSIGLDHMDRLGDSEEAIALQKAGIVKSGGVVISGVKQPECQSVIENVCREKQARLIPVSPVKVLPGYPVQFIWEGKSYTLNTAARYQAENAAVALTCLNEGRQRGWFEISEEALVQGLKQAVWAGRFEIMGHRPLVIIDGAHNVPGIEALCASVKELPHPQIIVFTALKDKETTGMAERLKQSCDQLIITQFDYFRAQTGKALTIEGSELIEDWKTAILSAKQRAQPEGTVVITGSLYFISEVRAWLNSGS